jgi:uncharacterized protein
MEFTDLLDVSTMTIATSGASGEPHAAAVYFASDEQPNLYFFSDTESQHIRDIAQGGRAAVTIYPECFDWKDIRGLQLRGTVSRVPEGPAWENAWERYLAKFPFVSDLQVEIQANALYVFTPHWIRLVDNRQGFGYKQEWNLIQAANSSYWLP